MPATDNILPEGTDTIITGAGVTDADDITFGGTGASNMGSDDYLGGTTGSPASAGTTAEQAKAKIADTASGLKGQAADKARSYATQGKDKATDALDNIASLVSDAALQVDDRVGEQYGAYARQAANAVSSLASTLREKDVDELFDDARNAVRKSPAIAIGAAAALGFVIARIAKAGTDTSVTPSSGTSPAPSPSTGYAAAYDAPPVPPVSPAPTIYDTPPASTSQTGYATPPVSPSRTSIPGVSPVNPVV